MQSLEKKEVKAVHTDDLEDVLKKLGCLDDFLNQRIKCKVCGDIITKENAGSIRRVEGNVQFTCNKTSCYTDAMTNS